MKQEIANRWVAALRSGEYEQGANSLRPSPGHYCCLGVLTDLYVTAGAREWDFACDTVLPEEVMLWAGMDSDAGLLHQNGACDIDADSLVDLNDGCRGMRSHTFAEIADVIEKYWEVL